MSAIEVERDRTVLLGALADLRRRPREPRVRLAIAEAEFRLAIAPETGVAEAVTRLHAAITEDPFLPKLYLHLGRLLHQSGRLRAALAEYRQAVRLAPSSRRAHLLIALALLELGKPEQELGQAMIKALDAGGTEDLRAVVAELDAMVQRQASGPVPAGTEAKKRPLRAAVKAKAASGGSPDTWRIALVEQLGRPKPVRAQVSAHLDVGSAQAKAGKAVAEYVTACVLMLANGDSPGDVRKLARPAVAGQVDHPTIALLDAALALAEAADPAEFVSLATASLDDKVLPAELVCWSHFTRYGPNSDLAAVEALRVLDAYPEQVRDLDCFRELRLAVLDGLARKAWAEERFDEARLLWRETIPLDPYRVPVAINLALLAARTRSTAEYGPAWDRLVELLYLHAAGAGDVQLLLEDRRTLHLALSQQSRLRHCAPAAAHASPTEEEMAAWVADTDALKVWLREWDLYYLNTRLGFRSPTHLLGVSADASVETLTAARDAFIRHIDSTLRTQDWAGIGAFCDLAAAQARACYAAAADPVGRARDQYYELEKAQAEALADEALRRGILLRSMTHVLIEQDSARNIALGCAIARRQFALPWPVLQPICAERGLIRDDVDLVALFESDLIGLAVKWDRPAADGQAEWSRRLVALDECVAVLPHRLELRFLRCKLLLEAGRDQDAYVSALAALEMPVPDDEEVRGLRDRLVALVSTVGYNAVAENLRSPADPATAERAIATAREALERFPRSAALRCFLADVLVALGGEARAKEAVALLSAGAEGALNAEERVEFETRLGAARGTAADEGVRARIKQLTEPASERVQEVIEELGQESGPETMAAAQTVVRQSLAEVAEALRMAEHAGLADEAEQLRGALSRLRDVESSLR